MHTQLNQEHESLIKYINKLTIDKQTKPIHT